VGQVEKGRGMTVVRVAVLAGDGIGPDVTGEAVKALPDYFDLVEIDAGAERYLATGDLLTYTDLRQISSCDALLFGAIGDPRVPDGVLERGILLRLRKELDLYVNLRPFPELGLTIVRENSEGLYAGVGAREADVATETSVNTRHAIARCARYAFDLAQRETQSLTLVHKTNVLTNAGSLWRDVVDEVSIEYPDVPVSYDHVDAAAYHLVVDRSRYDVVLTDNLFGDILSDLVAGLAGGLGSAASANLHPSASTRPTRCVGLFEPVHGSAPDIAGTGTADPTAATRAAQMLVAAVTGATEEVSA
jgi:3-isopropylmalate dehydrogenase